MIKRRVGSPQLRVLSFSGAATIPVSISCAVCVTLPVSVSISLSVSVLLPAPFLVSTAFASTIVVVPTCAASRVVGILHLDVPRVITTECTVPRNQDRFVPAKCSLVTGSIRKMPQIVHTPTAWRHPFLVTSDIVALQAAPRHRVRVVVLSVLLIILSVQEAAVVVVHVLNSATPRDKGAGFTTKCLLPVPPSYDLSLLYYFQKCRSLAVYFQQNKKRRRPRKSKMSR